MEPEITILVIDQLSRLGVGGSKHTFVDMFGPGRGEALYAVYCGTDMSLDALWSHMGSDDRASMAAYLRAEAVETLHHKWAYGDSPSAAWVRRFVEADDGE